MCNSYMGGHKPPLAPSPTRGGGGGSAWPCAFTLFLLFVASSTLLTLLLSPRCPMLSHKQRAAAAAAAAAATRARGGGAAAVADAQHAAVPYPSQPLPSTARALFNQLPAPATSAPLGSVTPVQALAVSSLYFRHLLACSDNTTAQNVSSGSSGGGGSSGSSSAGAGAGDTAASGGGSGGPKATCLPVASLHELRHPLAPKLLAPLHKLWAAHAPRVFGDAEGSAEQGQAPDAHVHAPPWLAGRRVHEALQRRQLPWWMGLWAGGVQKSAGEALPEGHCSTASGAALLQQVAEASQQLAAASCEHVAPSRARWAQAPPPPPRSHPSQRPSHGSHATASVADSKGEDDNVDPLTSMPFVTLRRLTMSMLQLLYGEGQYSGRYGEEQRRACSQAVEAHAPAVLRSFAAAHNCSRTARPAVELLHISKSGGTSMCQVAAKAGLSNPFSNMDKNCLHPLFRDDPKWSRLELERGVLPKVGPKKVPLWPAVDCSTRAWVQEKRLGCAARSFRLSHANINFYANELALHNGGDRPGSAHACPQLETMIMLRTPVQRTRSHVIEIDKVYSLFAKHGKQYSRSRDLLEWRSWAPALLDNYMTRSLLGRHFMHCREFGTLGEKELLSASLVLSSLDHVLLLEQLALNDVVLGAGLGWRQSVANTHWRWSQSHDLHDDLGFPPDSMSLLEAWNGLDSALYAWGGALLALDAAFHTGVAALTGRVARGAGGGGSGDGRKACVGADGEEEKGGLKERGLQGSGGGETGLPPAEGQAEAAAAALRRRQPRRAGLLEVRDIDQALALAAAAAEAAKAHLKHPHISGSAGLTTVNATSKQKGVTAGSNGGVGLDPHRLGVQYVPRGGYVNLNVSNEGYSLELNRSLLPFGIEVGGVGGGGVGSGVGVGVGSGGSVSLGSGVGVGRAVAAAKAGGLGLGSGRRLLGGSEAHGTGRSKQGRRDGVGERERGCGGESGLLFQLPLYRPTYRAGKDAR